MPLYNTISISSQTPMAILRTYSRLFSSAPPPSPIATAKGSRSAAIDDQILTEYLEKSLKIPDLTLPESHFPARIHGRNPAVIDLPSLLSRDDDSVRLLLASAADFGVFQITGHSISAEEIRSAFAVADRIFQIPMEKKRELNRYFGRGNGIREEFVWCRSGNTATEMIAEEIWPDKHLEFSVKLENISTKLHNIAENVGQILSDCSKRRRHKRLKEREPVLCVYRYIDDHFGHINHMTNNQHEENYQWPYALSLHVSSRDNLEFHVQSQQSSISFSAAPNAVVVTLGNQIQEWSLGELKSVTGKAIYGPSVDAGPTFSMEIMCSPSSLNHKLDQIAKTISLIDQMLIALSLVFLYYFLAFISSRFTKT